MPPTLIFVGYNTINFRFLQIKVNDLASVVYHHAFKYCCSVSLDILCSFQTYKQPRGLTSAFTMAVFPVLYFFTFLYYTDAGSVMFVLLTYLRALQGRHLSAAFAGTCAVMFRQTNIIWVIFVGASSACEKLLEVIQPDKRSDLEKTDVNLIRTISKWLYDSVMHERRSLVHAAVAILQTVWPYLTVVVGFAVFVWTNGGLVVGAKQDHEAGFHIPQFLYFFGFTVGFSFVHFVTYETVRSFISFTRRWTLAVLVAALLAVIAVWRLTYVHRYLVADNRHYTFYVWSKILSRHYSVRYLLVPVYLFAIFAVFRTVAARRHILWRVVYLCCVFAVLVPSTLLEFRYYIVPYLIIRLNIPCPTIRRLMTELGFYVVINLATLYMFLYRPFYWDSESSAQRFMW